MAGVEGVDFVWALNDQNKVTKCTAFNKEGKRGKCNHKIHSRPGESKSEFCNRYLIEESEDSKYVYVETEHISVDEMPDYSDHIREITSDIDKKYDNMTEVVESVINNDYLNNGGIGFLDASDKNLTDENGNPVDAKVNVSVVSEEVDPNDENATRIGVSFNFRGEESVEYFSIPTVDESGEFTINNTKYRCIPVIEYKEGVSVSREGNLKFKEGHTDNTIIMINKDSDEATIIVHYAPGELQVGEKDILDEDGNVIGKEPIYNDKFKKEYESVPVEELDKCMSGKDSILTEKQKSVVDRIGVIGKERYAELGMDGLRSLSPDALNDISYRHVTTYEDKVAFVVSKKFKSVDSVFRKRLKNGEEQDFSLGKLTENIKDELLKQSCVRISENLNPISALSQSQRITYCGPGAYKSDSLPDKIRFTHESYYDMIDTNDVSLGGNIGANIALKGGFIGKDSVIRNNGEDSLSCSDFIPFKENSDPNRGAMAVSQMKQAVPIIGGEDPKLSTKGWDKIKGSKLGVNLKVAYIPEAGVWEDAVIISESTAKKMTTVQSKRYQMSPNIPVKHEVGDFVKKGDRVGGALVEYPGKIRRIEGNSLEIETTYPMTVGDKLAGRHGNKGVVSKILPDSEMPRSSDGSHADIIMSPIGIAGRSNLGQVYEVNGGSGRINDKHEVSYKGHKIEATYGDQFVMRLNQIAEQKIHSNHNERTGDHEFKSRFGEMEGMLLTSSERRLEILNYLKHQETNLGEEKLMDTLKAIGVDMRAKK